MYMCVLHRVIYRKVFPHSFALEIPRNWRREQRKREKKKTGNWEKSLVFRHQLKNVELDSHSTLCEAFTDRHRQRECKMWNSGAIGRLLELCAKIVSEIFKIPRKKIVLAPFATPAGGKSETRRTRARREYRKIEIERARERYCGKVKQITYTGLVNFGKITHGHRWHWQVFVIRISIRLFWLAKPIASPKRNFSNTWAHYVDFEFGTAWKWASSNHR